MSEVAILSAEQRRELAEAERVIASGLKVFSEVGASLLLIRDGRLYRETHGTFEDYCRVKWDISRSRAYYLIKADEVMRDLSSMEDKPGNERQTRPLTPLAPEERVAAWQEAVASAPAGKAPTERGVREAVAKVTGAKPNTAPPPSDPLADVEIIMPATDPTPATVPPARPAPDTFSFGQQYADLAIVQLSKISRTDTQRAAAFKRVSAWINAQPD